MKRVGLGLAIILLTGLFGCCISDVEDTTKSDKTPSTQPVKTHTKEPKGSLSNPGSMGEPVVVKTSSGTFEITVTDAIRGEKAWQIAKTGNMFNDEPEDGYEYLLVKVRFKYKSGKIPNYISKSDFNAYCDGAGYSPAFAILPNDYPEFKSVKLMLGGKVEG